MGGGAKGRKFGKPGGSAPLSGSGLCQTVWSICRRSAKFSISNMGPFGAELAMYAVFEDGSRQYRVSEGDVVKVDYREAEIGSRLEFQRVLLCQSPDGLSIGQPVIDGARILGEVVDHPSIKLYIQHFRRRKNYRRLRGHRQHYTAIRVRSILLPGMQPPVETPPPETSEKAPAMGAAETPAS
jgi:large subunit ribosomal protein L21